MADKLAVIVAIDFGNTYTGMAWVPQGLDDEIVVKSCWPNGDPETCRESRASIHNPRFPSQLPKAPSTLSLHPDRIGQWGYIVCPCSKEVLRGLKALFDDAEHPTTYGPSLESKQLLTKYGKTLVDEVGYYLNYAVAACTPDWRERFNHVPYAIKAVFTVPAAWSEETRDRFLVAVDRLGLSDSNVMLVSEPEAAVVDVLKNVKEHGVEKGDVVTVCDAGGATVDLISYRVDELEPLKLTNVTKPESRICGSTMLDTGFEDHMKKMVGPERWQNFPHEDLKNALRSYWHNEVKPKYTGDYEHDFPDSEYVHMTKIDNVNYKALILTGGLGSSKYLFRELEKRLPNLKLIQPPDAGALYHGLEAHPKESITAPHNYGLKTTVEFDEKADGDKETAYYDELIERWYIDDAKRVIIDKGEKILENVPRKADFSRDVALNHNLVFQMPLISCDCDLLKEDGGAAEDACLDDRCTENGAQYDDGCIIGILEADFSTAPSEHFHIKTNSKGQEYCHFHFDFVVTPKAKTLVFELQIKGVTYGGLKWGIKC
ncbi:hypothetical protein BJX62DRAFT_235123 [Aspergillus germanicus]